MSPLIRKDKKKLIIFNDTFFYCYSFLMERIICDNKSNIIETHGIIFEHSTSVKKFFLLICHV